MNLKQLEAFVYVADYKSFSKAAKKLYLTQPTVSAHISALEKEFSTRLFIRNTKEVELSEEGRELYVYGKKILDLCAQVEERFSTREEEQSNKLVIAASTIPAQFVLPQLLARYREKYPMDEITLFESDSQDVAEKVSEHQVDLGFTGTTYRKKNCKYVPFYKDDLVIVTPNRDEFCGKKEEKMGDLSWVKERNVILREKGSGTRKEAEKQLKQMGISPDMLHVIAEIDNTETIKRSVRQGMGITFLSALAVKEEAEDEKVLTFPLGPASRNLCYLYNKNYTPSKPAKRFIKILEEMYGEN